jgi:pilus assembly protein CpaB
MQLQRTHHRWSHTALAWLSVLILAITSACDTTTQQSGQDQAPSEGQLEDDSDQSAPSGGEAKGMLEDTVSVIRAARDVAKGTPLTDDNVTAEDVPRQFLPPNPILEDEFDIYAGQPVSSDIQEGAMVLASDFAVSEASGDLSARVPPDMRALPIGFGNLREVCEALRPGDRIDVVGTFAVDEDGDFHVGEAGSKPAGRVTMTLLQVVTVLAVGPETSAPGGSKERANCSEFDTITVAVTQEEAELLSAAKDSGELMLMLRNPDDLEVKPVERRPAGEMLDSVEELNKRRKATIRKPPEPPGRKGVMLPADDD